MTDPGDASRGGDGWHSFFDDRVHVSAGCDIPNALYGWPPSRKTMWRTDFFVFQNS